jgi:hypothetical protein
VGVAGDIGVVIAAVMAVIGLIAVIVKWVRWYDKRKDDRFAVQVREIIEPIITERTKTIQPGARNGGSTLTDLSDRFTHLSSEVAGVSARVERAEHTLQRLDTRSQSMEQRQIEMEAQASEAAETRDRIVDNMEKNGTVVWDALRGLGADIPDMIEPQEGTRDE